MRQASLVLLLAALLLAAPAIAQGNASTNSSATTNATATNESAPIEPAPVEFTLVGHQDGAATYWTVEGLTGHNPTIHVEPGQVVTFHVKSETGSHNFKIATEKVSKIFNEGEAGLDVVWTAPATPGDVVYICALHGPTMSGKVAVGQSAPATGAGAGSAGAITGDTVDLGDLGVAECKGYKIPAAAASHATGGPTLADYTAKCKAGNAEVSTARAAHPADRVIPISIALIVLGLVGTVWVTRRYHP